MPLDNPRPNPTCLNALEIHTGPLGYVLKHMNPVLVDYSSPRLEEQEMGKVYIMPLYARDASLNAESYLFFNLVSYGKIPGAKLSLGELGYLLSRNTKSVFISTEVVIEEHAPDKDNQNGNGVFPSLRLILDRLIKSRHAQTILDHLIPGESGSANLVFAAPVFLQSEHHIFLNANLTINKTPDGCSYAIGSCQLTDSLTGDARRMDYLGHVLSKMGATYVQPKTTGRQTNTTDCGYHVIGEMLNQIYAGLEIENPHLTTDIPGIKALYKEGVEFFIDLKNQVDQNHDRQQREPAAAVPTGFFGKPPAEPAHQDNEGTPLLSQKGARCCCSVM